MSVPREIERQVRLRARNRCEYCGMHQSLQGATFHVEHIGPKSRGGESILDNLDLACPSCNLHKADREMLNDPETNRAVRLFHPRLDRWTDHFHWHGLELIGLTDLARATAAALDFNHPRRIKIRAAEERLGLFPPDDEDAPGD